ncbi:LuxR C-terminal-related transcriptional regulator [Streptomyces atroolivaceus]|uniref:LuxR C-terminal-related transcriptional regulator n=1 Tax=Streptomyces atroolivaceus TaxID=66869 RepID=UPI00366667AB
MPLSPAAAKALIKRFLRSRQEETVPAIPEPLRILTARKRQVMSLVAAGDTDEEIASGLAVSPLDVAVVTLETS